MIKIAADLGGADKPQSQLAEGVIRAAEMHEDLFVYALGDKKQLSPLLEGRERIELVDAPEVITNGEDPSEAFKARKNSSLVRGMELCRSDKEIGAFVTCGPTGAIFVAAVMMLGRIARVSPMLTVELTRPDGSSFCVVDCGANVDVRAEKLVDFARMGIAYMKAAGTESPKVGLLSNGAEDKKGSEVVKKANALLRESVPEFIGNVEGHNVLNGEADVIVCDGFSGNILLKTVEGAAKAVIAELRASGLSGEALDRIYRKYDYNTQGGAVLLGTGLPIVKGHGAADSETVKNIILTGYRLAKNGLNEKIAMMFKK
ncbi:phosphate:acyl-[acyl carrier protein] acyltransferase [Ruminococcaceae bacterium FB2012]|nr:phosphate:acyl-[acyl carrier protein] acyltransferase [Ruminococcaceae bacterium FB2012]